MREAIPAGTRPEIARAVRAAQEGDREAVGELYAAYERHIYWYCRRRLPDRWTAEDVTSETFIRVLTKIDMFTWQGSDFQAWLTTIARNLVADYFKTTYFRYVVPVAEMQDVDLRQEADAYHSVAQAFFLAALEEAMVDLTAEQRDCLRLRFVHRFSEAETANAMEKTELAVKLLQHRAVKALKRGGILERWWRGEDVLAV